MTRLTSKTILSSTLAMALAACGGETEQADEVATPEPAPTAEYDPMSRDYTLSDDAQARRDEFDVDAFQSEYGDYRDEIVEEHDDPSEVEAGSDATYTPSPGATRDAATNMMAREDMSWSYLDRNNDGQLSVAEYAIWAIPLDPTAEKPNDAAPYVTAEQANKAADSFFYYDIDGDTYLSQREFTSARRGDDLG